MEAKEDEAEKLSHAPYGKACLNCVKSKTRCASRVDKEKCERFVCLHFYIGISSMQSAVW